MNIRLHRILLGGASLAGLTLAVANPATAQAPRHRWNSALASAAASTLSFLITGKSCSHTSQAPAASPT